MPRHRLRINGHVVTSKGAAGNYYVKEPKKRITLADPMRKRDDASTNLHRDEADRAEVQPRHRTARDQDGGGPSCP